MSLKDRMLETVGCVTDARVREIETERDHAREERDAAREALEWLLGHLPVGTQIKAARRGHRPSLWTKTTPQYGPTVWLADRPDHASDTGLAKILTDDSRLWRIKETLMKVVNDKRPPVVHP